MKSNCGGVSKPFMYMYFSEIIFSNIENAPNAVGIKGDCLYDQL